MATQTARKKASKKTTSKKTTTRKKAVKKSASRKKAVKKSASRKTVSSKKTAVPTEGVPKKPASRRTASKAASQVETEEIVGQSLNGTAILTANGRAPSKGALAYLDEKQVRILKGFNPRTSGVGDIGELKRGIRANGLLEPLVVRPSGNGKTYDLVAGERRITALRELGGRFASEIPVVIRMDLEGDDATAKAVAANENSDDARTALNTVEVGQLADELRGQHGWDVKQIARHTGYSEKAIRRALQIYEAPTAIREKVRSGEMSSYAALEFTQLPESRQKELEGKVGPNTTAAEIRTLRKRVEAEEKRDAASSGKGIAKKTKDGKPSKAATVASWQNPRAKTAWLRELCYVLNDAEGDAIGTTEYHEIRGAVGWLLFDRGDIETPYLPALDPSEDEDPTAASTLNAALDAIIAQEAARHEPEEEVGE